METGVEGASVLGPALAAGIQAKLRQNATLLEAGRVAGASPRKL